MYGVTPTTGVLFTSTQIVPNTPAQLPEDLTAVPSGDQSSRANWAWFPSFLKTNRSVSANTPRIRHRLEPALKSSLKGITLRKTLVHTGWPHACHHAQLLCLLYHSPKKVTYLEPSSWRFCVYIGATFLCHQTTFCATKQLLNARQVRTMAKHQSQSRLLPTVMPICYPAALKHLGTICQNAGFEGWVGFCF